ATGATSGYTGGIRTTVGSACYTSTVRGGACACHASGPITCHADDTYTFYASIDTYSFYANAIGEFTSINLRFAVHSNVVSAIAWLIASTSNAIATTCILAIHTACAVAGTHTMHTIVTAALAEHAFAAGAFAMH